jgi:hypothetical protein
MLIPIRNGRFKLTAVLQSVTLLETAFAQVNFHFQYKPQKIDKKQTSVDATNKRIKQLLKVPTSQLKRTLLNEEEEEMALSRND